MPSHDDTEPLDDTKPSGHSGVLALTSFCAAIGGTFLFGYNISIVSAPAGFIQSFINDTYRERLGTGLHGDLVTLIWTVIVSAFPLGGWLGALISGPMSVHCGRKNSLLVNNVFLFAGAALVLTCRVARSFEMIVFARFLVGINSGVSMNIQPMYLGESAPKHLRGAVGFSCSVFIALGIFMGQVVGLTELLGCESLWTYLLASNAIPGLIQLLTLPWLPESPRYLLIDRGDREACLKALERLRGGRIPVWEIEELFEEQQQQTLASKTGSGFHTKSLCSLLTDRTLRSQLVIVIVSSVGMVFCGIDAIYSYASYIFLQAGICPADVQYATIGTGISELVASTLSNLVIERVGRRFLLVGGYGLMTGCALVFTVSLLLQSRGVVGMAYLNMACVFAYIICFGMGPAGVGGVLPAELFDQASRPAAYMVYGSFLWINLFLMGLAFPFMVEGLGDYCFLPFLLVCLGCAVFLGATLLETRGKTVAEITAEYERKNEKKKNKSETKGGDSNGNLKDPAVPYAPGQGPGGKVDRYITSAYGEE